MPDFNNILPIISACIPKTKYLSISTENVGLTKVQEKMLEYFSIPYEINQNPDPTIVESAIFEWGPGIPGNLPYEIYRRYISGRGFKKRTSLLKRFKDANTRLIAMPHGFDVKYGIHNNKLPLWKKLIPVKLLLSSKERNIFNGYCVESILQRQRYEYLGLNKDRIYTIPFIPYFREWLDKDSAFHEESISNLDDYKDKKLFILPKFGNDLHYSKLNTCLSIIKDDPSFIFAVHPRNEHEHINYLRNRFPDLLGRITSKTLPITNLIRLCHSVHDVGSSLGVLCASMVKPYYIHTYLSPSRTIFEELGHPLICTSEHVLPPITSFYEDFCNQFYDIYVTKRTPYSDACEHIFNIIYRGI